MSDDQDVPIGEEYPQFRTVLRGYDPSQVEEVLDDLYASLEDAVKYAEDSAADADKWRRAHVDATASLEGAKHRIAELEKTPSSSGSLTYESLGSRIAQILETANAEAEDIRQRAAAEAQSRHDELRAAAVATRAETDHYATQVREQAESDAARIVADAQAKAREIQVRLDAMTEELRGARDRAEADAAAIRQQARDEASRLLAEAEASTSRLHQEAARRRQEASEHRARIRAELAELRQQLAPLIGGTGEGTPSGHNEAKPNPNGRTATSAEDSAPNGTGAVDRVTRGNTRRSRREEDAQPRRNTGATAAGEPEPAAYRDHSPAADRTTEVLPADPESPASPLAPAATADTKSIPLPPAGPADRDPVDDPGSAGPARSRVSEPLQWAPVGLDSPAGADEEDFDDSFQGEAWDREEASAHRR